MDDSKMSKKNEARTLEIVAKTTPYNGFFKIDIYRFRHRLYRGGWSPILSREVFERGHAASILLYDPWLDRVVLVEQFRAGAYAAGLTPWILEVVAGIIEPQEEAESVVRRESVEEAGQEVLEIERIGRFIMTPGGSSETIAMYCGCIDSRGAGGLFGLHDEGEDIRALPLSLQEAMTMVADGRIISAPAVISLQWLALNQIGMRQQWQDVTRPSPPM